MARTKADGAKPLSPYLRWRVTQEKRSELSSIKMQGYWRDKDDVEFVDYLVQLGKRVYVNSILPYEAGDKEIKSEDESDQTLE